MSAFTEAFHLMQVKVVSTAIDKGWWSEPVFNDGEKIALMHSELSEVLEALRKGEPPDKHLPEFTSTEVELADAVIRIMDYAEYRGLRLAEAVEAKVAYNETRPHKHGGKRF